MIKKIEIIQYQSDFNKDIYFSSLEDAQLGLSNQIMQMVAFIKSNKKLFDALNNHDWPICAYYYNGSGYKQLAKKLGITPYDIQLANAYAKYKSIK